MKNRNGFTLIELLVAITISGIIMIMTLPAIHNLQRENQEKKFDDYERAVLEAAKAYEDQYEEDLFGRSDTGCASINYVDLVNKKLLTTTKIAGYECNNDKNGIIIRKVKGTSYYEVYLTCNKGTNDIKNLTGNNDDFNNIKSNHCNTGEDNDPPILSIKCDGDNYDHATIGDDGNRYYTTALLPELTVQASDSITGLEKNQYVTYEWKTYNDKVNNTPNKIEKNKTTFNTKDGASSTAEKKVRIVEEFKKEGSTGKAVVDLSGDNIIDRAGNKLSLEEDSATENCQYFYDNAIPDIEINVIGESTGNSYNPTANDWIKEPVTIIVTANDKTNNNIYAGINKDSLTVNGSHIDFSREEDKNYTYELRNQTNREINENYKICDKLGNCNSANLTIKIDTQAPTCSIKGDGQWRVEGARVTMTCDDPKANGISSGVQSCNGSSGTTFTSNIKNNVTWTVVDNAGNTNTCSYNVQNKRQYYQVRCNEGKRCEAAGCEEANTCTHKRCGYSESSEVYCYNTNSTGGGYGVNTCQECDSNYTGTSESFCYFDGDGDVIKVYRDYYTCKREDPCGCKRWNKNIERCGCQKWNSTGTWKDDSCNSNSCKVTNTRLVYK